MSSCSKRVPLAVLAFASTALAQFTEIPPVPYPGFTPPCPDVAYAFVDPANGTDPLDSTQALAKLNQLDSPFRTIQAAIDSAQLGAIQLYSTYPSASGLVTCLPGVYGPMAFMGDTLPITMRDRVHVHGQGARRTVLRGNGTSPMSNVFWPDMQTTGSTAQAEILVDFREESPFFGNPMTGPLPWGVGTDTEEMFDSFTLEGGDVQVMLRGEGVILGRVSNCVFDMRDDPDGIRGPWFGIMMTHTFYGQEGITYFDIPANILNNTFVLGEEMNSTSLLARPEAVAICDVVNPAPAGATPDANLNLRGFGNPSIQNNLIRSLPWQTATMEMLGIDDADTSVRANPVGGSVPGPTNAFHASRVGGTNGYFWSVLPTSPPPTILPIPKRDLDDITQDPGFVGEALSFSGLAPVVYRDWRLLPGSPMTDAGSNPLANGILIASNGTFYRPARCPDLQSLVWDMEAHGNPRRVGTTIDIGADEIHGYLMTSSWANDSANHNAQAAHLCLDPNSQNGAPGRQMLFPMAFVGASLRVNGIETVSNCGTTSPIAWLLPPGSLVLPNVDPMLPVDYETRYIPANNPAPAPTPWLGTITAQILTDPVSGLMFPVGCVRLIDAFNSTPSNNFVTQAVVTIGTVKYRCNLQPEYR